MFERVMFIFALCCCFIVGCSKSPSAPAAFGMKPPAAWGPAVEDKIDEWSGEMATSPKDVLDGFVSQYKGWSKTTQVEEQSPDHVVLQFDLADLVKGMSSDTKSGSGITSTKAVNRRLLIEVKPDGEHFVVRSRSFNIPG